MSIFRPVSDLSAARVQEYIDDTSSIMQAISTIQEVYEEACSNKPSGPLYIAIERAYRAAKEMVHLRKIGVKWMREDYLLQYELKGVTTGFCQVCKKDAPHIETKCVECHPRMAHLHTKGRGEKHTDHEDCWIAGERCVACALNRSCL